MKKFSIVLIVIALMVSIVAACSGGNNNPENTPPDTGTNTPDDSGSNNNNESDADTSNKPAYWSEEPTSIKMMGYNHPTWPFDEEWAMLDWHEEQTNIRIEQFEYAGEFKDAIALTVASGETPDVIQFTGNSDAMRFGQMGALVDMSQHLDKMPNFAEWLDNHPTQKAVGTSPDGEIFMATTQGVNIISVRNWMYRQDIFEEHNLEVPTDWDELYAVSKELKEQYPDSYPFTFRGGISQFYTLAPAFNTWYDYYPDPVTGEVKYGPVTDEMKELATWLNKFYAEGLMAPDWLSMTTGGWVENMTTGKTFITIDYALRIPPLNNTLDEEGNGGVLAQMPPALGHPDGGISNGNKSTIGSSIFTTTKNLDASLKYIDYLHSKEGQQVASWGKEGESYELVNGKKQYIVENLEGGNLEWSALSIQYGIQTSGLYGWIDPAAALASYSEDERELYSEAAKYSWDEDPILPPNFTEQENETIGSINNSILTVMEQNIAKFIIGERDLSEWDAYVDEMYELGLQQVIDIYAEGWERAE